MKIRLLSDIPGHRAGEVLNAVPNWQRIPDAPKWIAADDDVVGVYSYEAEVLQECGHPVASIVSDLDDGTNYCAGCAANWQQIAEEPYG